MGSPLALAEGRDAAVAGGILEELSRLELGFWQLCKDLCAHYRMSL